VEAIQNWALGQEIGNEKEIGGKQTWKNGVKTYP